MPSSRITTPRRTRTRWLADLWLNGKVADGYNAQCGCHVRDIEHARAQRADAEVDEISDKPVVPYAINQVSNSTGKYEYDGHEQRKW